jgi:hypothetical protein
MINAYASGEQNMASMTLRPVHIFNGLEDLSLLLFEAECK